MASKQVMLMNKTIRNGLETKSRSRRNRQRTYAKAAQRSVK